MFFTASAFLVAGSVGWKEEDLELSHHLGKDAKGNYTWFYFGQNISVNSFVKL